MHRAHNSDIKKFLFSTTREEKRRPSIGADLPLPVARLHDLFNGPYLLVARCFICTRIFAYLPGLQPALWKMMIVFSGCYCFFSPSFSSTAPENRQITASLAITFATVFDRDSLAYANRFECLLKI